MNCSIQPSLALRCCLARASAASFVQPFAQRCAMVGITVGVACTSGHSMQSGGGSDHARNHHAWGPLVSCPRTAWFV
jgi:hypothetical protein